MHDPERFARLWVQRCVRLVQGPRDRGAEDREGSGRDTLSGIDEALQIHAIDPFHHHRIASLEAKQVENGQDGLVREQPQKARFITDAGQKEVAELMVSRHDLDGDLPSHSALSDEVGLVHRAAGTGPGASWI